MERSRRTRQVDRKTDRQKDKKTDGQTYASWQISWGALHLRIESNLCVFVFVCLCMYVSLHVYMYIHVGRLSGERCMCAPEVSYIHEYLCLSAYIAAGTNYKYIKCKHSHKTYNANTQTKMQALKQKWYKL